MEYAAFIITYERPEILSRTIDKLLQQTTPPTHVLVVDNSATKKTCSLIDELGNPIVSYYSTGYNSGAAGGAFYGLTLLAEKGFDWILWVDDDDPPSEVDLIERLIKSMDSYPDSSKIGVIGTVGSDFNYSTGELRRFTNDELIAHEFIEARCVAGGMFPLINSTVVKKGAVPNKDFFFSFEDLDFCLKVLDLGYKVVVPTAIMIERRKSRGRWDFALNNLKVLRQVPIGSLWREYYSVRNMTYLFSHTRRNRFVLARYCMKYMVKILLSYTKGAKFGWRTTYYTVLGFAHGLTGRLGRTVLPVPKYL